MMACAGFDGVFIDRYGFDDGGSALECSISDLLAAPPLLSANGRCLFFPLTAYRENLQHSCTPGEWQIRRDRALSPVLAQWIDGFTVPQTKESDSFHWCESRGTFIVKNGLDHARRVRLEMELDTFTDQPAPLRIEGSLVSGEYLISKERRRIVWTGFVPPGKHSIRLARECPSTTGVHHPCECVFRVYALSLRELE
jgi:phosphoglycerol transferase